MTIKEKVLQDNLNFISETLELTNKEKFKFFEIMTRDFNRPERVIHIAVGKKGLELLNDCLKNYYDR